MPETIENRIFEKFKQDLTTYYYVELLIDQQDNREKLYSGAVATFTGGGTLFAFTNLFDHTIVYTIITFITSFIAALIVIFNKFSSIYIKSPDEIRKLTDLHQKLYLQAEQVQPILRRLRSEEIKPSLAEDQFSKFLEKNAKNNTEASRLIGKINNKLNDEAKNRVDTYIKAVYY